MHQPRSSAPSFDDLVQLLAHDGPLLTVYLQTDDHDEPLPARWSALRAELAAGGAPERALLQIQPLIDDSPGPPGTLVAIADERQLVLLDQLDESFGADTGRWGVVAPELVPLVCSRRLRAA